ncbi:TPA: undecaprenyl-phosphate glucose phosphotransferase [Klebsiella pneumoniae]|nr:undecaprenyl-phosphate glucose phosphotransferase [Klebsiella pneumoniae]EKZ9953114.1 undecaprenyl-phosphate glucose phosphotransferase [Klebsiella pneumoniae]MDC8796773.1 undecaprenyl-phosphate glucose phosphotransferase [Klebsiella pneumoniae]HBQ8067295.1 undecaprenyl-phosphate glucose phosphotransferase [Klebsiella pneumoniae]HBS4017675.1 undecaprenyl-phosphate glucose phosphotransferase [Klebsiella pneumoniae]
MIGGITDFYRSWRGVKISTELKIIIQNWTLSIVFTSGILSFLAGNDLEIEFFFCWYIIVSLFLIVSRFSIRALMNVIRKLGYNTRIVALAGNIPVGINLMKSFAEEPWLGLKVKGIYCDCPPTNSIGLPYSGKYEDLICEARKGEIDRIYIAMDMQDDKKLKKLVKGLADTTCSVLLIPDIFTFNILQSRTEEVNGVPVVPLFDTPLNGINSVLKRLEDIVLSLIILILISPVLIVIACIVKYSSKGPILFRQTRYGMDGKSIQVWKFRTMVVQENGNVVTQAVRGDVRVTNVGRFLRRTSLDELPQFFNVLFGSMSIVGPRPHAVAHNEQYRTLIEGYMLRHKVKPGITGLAQIKGWRGETDTLEKMQKRVEYDLEYIREWSLWLDLKIIFLTVFKGFVNKSAY